MGNNEKTTPLSSGSTLCPKRTYCVTVLCFSRNSPGSMAVVAEYVQAGSIWKENHLRASSACLEHLPSRYASSYFLSFRQPATKRAQG
jgi:hypothetical protein